MSTPVRKILEDLERDIAIQSTECGKNCRHVVFAIFAAAWGLLIKEDCIIGRFELSVILLVGVAYLIIETWRYYSTAKKARSLYKDSKKLTDDYIDQEMTKKSAWTFSILYIQMWICIVMAVALSLYIIFKFF